METVNDDDTLNVCPICHRGFKSVAGLKQHWSKGHTQKEISRAITLKTKSQKLSLQPNPNSRLLNADKQIVHKWDQFQVIQKDDSATPELQFFRFDIVDTNATGNCLFYSVWESLKIRSDVTTPGSAMDLRFMAVNHIISSTDADGRSNFDRYQAHLIDNLHKEIPSFNKAASPVEVMIADYYNYMTSPNKYGTVSELCALSEIFNFGFCVVREESETSYSCSDYGSISQSHGLRSVVHLLFVGEASNGHFKLLQPKSQQHYSGFTPGRYKLIYEHTSSMCTTIAPAKVMVSGEDHEMGPFRQQQGARRQLPQNLCIPVSVKAKCARRQFPRSLGIPVSVEAKRIFKRVLRRNQVTAAKKLAQQGLK